MCAAIQRFYSHRARFSQAIDGLVHEFGGEELQRALAALPDSSSQPPGTRCPAGSAVLTEVGGELLQFYPRVIHAVAPFYQVSPSSAPCALGLTACLGFRA